MNKIFTLLLVLFSTLCYSQGWQWQSPKPQANNLRGIYLFDTNTSWTVGDCGTIMKSIDGGKTWTLKYKQNQFEHFNDIFFTSTLKGFIVGTDGSGTIILKTTDGGSTWTKKTITEMNGKTPGKIYFKNANLGWICGETGMILKTTDGGDTWTVSTSGVASKLNDILFANDSIGWAVGANGVVLKTRNAGKTWKNVSSPSQFTQDLYKLSLIDTANAFVCGNRIFACTKDGGTSWTFKNNWTYEYFVDLNFTSLTEGVMNGRVSYRTTDGGVTWTSNAFTQSPYGNPPLAGSHIGTHVITVGLRGAICRTDNLTSWTLSTQPAPIWFETIYFKDNNTGFASGRDGACYNTSDGGTTWKHEFNTSSNDIVDIDVVDNTLFQAGGGFSAHNITSKQMLQSKSVSGAKILYAIDFVTEQIGWVGGMSYSNLPVLLKTTDAGANFSAITLPTVEGESLRLVTDICFINNNEGWVAVTRSSQGSSIIFKTKDAGVTWEYTKIVSGDIDKIQFINNTTGWLIIGNTVAYTTDAGNTWTKGPMLSEGANSIRFFDANNGLASSSKGTVYRTYNGGKKWYALNKIDNLLTAHSYFVDLNTFYLTDQSSVILKYSGNPEIHMTNGASKLNHLSKLNYPNTNIGITSSPINIKITNIGTGSLSLHGKPRIKLEGNNPGDFVLDTISLAQSLNSGDSTTFSLYFKPLSGGSKSAKLLIYNNSELPVIEIYVVGSGIGPDINLKEENNILTNGSAVTFDNTSITSTTSKFITIENLGTSALNLTGNPRIVLDNTNNPQFTVKQTAVQSSLAAGSKVQFEIIFKPTSYGTKTNSIKILSNDPDEATYIIELEGTATEINGIFNSDKSGNNITVYPNPTSDKIRINNNDLYFVTINTIEGSILLEQSLTQPNSEIDLTKLNKGIYILSIYNQEKQLLSIQKLIKN